jgi:chemotaxis protein histidine kinase CheA
MIYLLVIVVALALVALGLWLGRRQTRPSHAGGGRGGSAEEVDDDLRGVFINEVRSEIGNLRRNLMLWKAAPANFNRLMPLRRSFHTLKGSSRMIGVPALGDFNARFERLLDRVIDKSLPPDPAVVAVVEQAVAALPELLAQFEGTRQPRLDIAAIMKTADRLIKAERAVVRPLRSAGGSDDSLPATAAVTAGGVYAEPHLQSAIADSGDTTPPRNEAAGCNDSSSSSSDSSSSSSDAGCSDSSSSSSSSD